jgi:hypothetical protein
MFDLRVKLTNYIIILTVINNCVNNLSYRDYIFNKNYILKIDDIISICLKMEDIKPYFRLIDIFRLCFLVIIAL